MTAKRTLKRDTLRRLERAALRVHYWFMQPTDNDEKNSPLYRKAFADFLVCADEHRRALGKPLPSRRTGLSTLE